MKIGLPMSSSTESLDKLDAWWRAANYLTLGQIYLINNPLLQYPLAISDIKSRLVGHWGSAPGLNFIYAHLNRIIKRHNISILNITGPGHGGAALIANAWLEGTYSEVYPHIPQNIDGMQRLFKQFSFPGGVSSHLGPETPGSIHEGGELGYSLAHAFGAAFDNPNLLVACVIGDGEAETGPLAASWHSNKFLNPACDGAVLPILHLNGYKIASPTLLSRIPKKQLASLLQGYGYTPYFVEGDDPQTMHKLMAKSLDMAINEIQHIQFMHRNKLQTKTPLWPVIVLRSPKGWTGPKLVNGLHNEGTFRAHQVPIDDVSNPINLRQLEDWFLSYRPHELFNAQGHLAAEIAQLAPSGEQRMSANCHANYGSHRNKLTLPDFQLYAVAIKIPGVTAAKATHIQGQFIRDLIELNPDNFRVFSPDETNSNRWNAVFEKTNRCWNASRLDGDDHLATNGRIMEVLSEHLCEGWLEGYLLTGRHGFFSCYEAFIHIIDSMFNQHAKWLRVSNRVAWRAPIASLNYLLSSHVWQQDHNGFSHQDPGFLDHVASKKADVIRIYLPPDANSLLAITDHCVRSENYINVIVAGKQAAPQWLDIQQAIKHCEAGLSIWDWASSAGNSLPELVMACCGDVPTLETMAAVELLRDYLPDLRVRVINIVDLMRLENRHDHPHGLSNTDFNQLFTLHCPIIFAFHGYPALIHRLIYQRDNHHNFHVHGYCESGGTTTAFDILVRNRADRFHLVLNALSRLPAWAPKASELKQYITHELNSHQAHIAATGTDLPHIQHWQSSLYTGKQLQSINSQP